MSNIVQNIFFLFAALSFTVFAVFYLIKTKQKHDAIDSVADARVIKVLNLGRGLDGKTQFAITYQVLLDAPFEILVTPTSIPADMGAVVTIYYDALDHNNYYIPTKWKVDDRMKKAWLLLAFALIVLAGCIMTFF